MVTIEINNPKLEAIYSEKELVKMIFDYIKKLEEEKELEENFYFYEVDEKNLNLEEQEALKYYRENKENIKFYDLRPSDYGI